MSLPLVAVLLADCGVTEPEGPITLQIAGTVVSAGSGLPIANARVELGYPSVGCGAGTVQDAGVRTTETDAAGRYTHRYDNPCQVPFPEGGYSGINCGGISLHASATGHAAAYSATRIRCVAEVQLITFTLYPVQPEPGGS
ncbi:MAG: hypothetical protein ACREL9_02335 [Gemmatimonadales bacterium]